MRGLTITEVLEVLALRPDEGVNLATADGRLFIVEWLGGDWFIIDDVADDDIQPRRGDDVDTILQSHGGITDLLDAWLHDDWTARPCIMVLTDAHAS